MNAFCRHQSKAYFNRWDRTVSFLSTTDQRKVNLRMRPVCFTFGKDRWRRDGGAQQRQTTAKLEEAHYWDWRQVEKTKTSATKYQMTDMTTAIVSPYLLPTSKTNPRLETSRQWLFHTCYLRFVPASCIRWCPIQCPTCTTRYNRGNNMCSCKKRNERYYNSPTQVEQNNVKLIYEIVLKKNHIKSKLRHWISRILEHGCKSSVAVALNWEHIILVNGACPIRL